MSPEAVATILVLIATLSLEAVKALVWALAFGFVYRLVR